MGTYKVQDNGKAQSGLGVGDKVVTAGGTYEITGVKADGSYESKLSDKNTTTKNYTGSYSSGSSSSGASKKTGGGSSSGASKNTGGSSSSGSSNKTSTGQSSGSTTSSGKQSASASTGGVKTSGSQSASASTGAAQLPALNQYGYRDIDYSSVIPTVTDPVLKQQLTDERNNKITHQYGGVEPNMAGSNQKFSQTQAGSSGSSATSGSNGLVKGPGYVTGGYTTGVYGVPILKDNPYWSAPTAVSKSLNSTSIKRGADMSRRPDLANGMAVSNGYTVYYDENGYATHAVKGAVDYLPTQDPNVSKGTYNSSGSWTDNQMLSKDELNTIQKYRESAAKGDISWSEANAAANAIRGGYGYTIDGQGNVFSSGVSSAINARRQNLGLPVQPDGATAYYNYLMGTDTSPMAQALGQVKTYQQFATENGYDVNVPTASRNFDYSAPTGINGTVPIVQTTPMPGNSVIGGSGAAGGGASGSGNLGMSPGTADVYTPGNMGDYLNQWYQNAQQQQQNTIDFGTNQALLELLRAKQDADAQYQEQRNQIAIDEAKAKDNQALYAEARGDKGGIGAAQYDAIMNSAAQNRLAVNSAQTKLATDTSRQIADLRAQGEYEKADALLTLSQQYLSQLMSLEQWAAEYNLSVAQFNASLKQWQAEYDLKVADLLGSYNGQKTMSAKQFEFTQQQYADSMKSAQDEKLASAGEILLAAGIMPSASQLAAMGMTETDAQSYITAQKVAAAAKEKSSNPTGDPVKTQDYDGLMTAARSAPDAKSFIANNYKKYGFTSSTGLYDYYNSTWLPDNQTADTLDPDKVNNPHGDKMVQIKKGNSYTYMTWAAVANWIDKGKIKIRNDGNDTYTLVFVSE